MTSRLAESTYQQWLSEGLKPSFKDICDLNAVGINLERNSDSSAFYSIGRIGFLGDYIFHEPTIAKRIYIDELTQILGDDAQSQIYAISYVLFTDTCDLPSLNDKKKIVKAIARFTKDILSGFSETQIIACMSYVLTGNDELEGMYGNNETQSVKDIPDSCSSYAMQLLNKALAYNIPKDSADDKTIKQLEDILALVAIKSGQDVLKDKNIELTGKFYTVSGKIYSRLKKEKEEREIKDKENGISKQ